MGIQSGGKLGRSVGTVPRLNLKRTAVDPYIRTTLLVLLLAMAVRLLASGVFELDFMESYGVVVARQPSLSYFDQPPLTWWLIAAVTRLFRTETASVVRLPFILVFTGSAWLMFRLAESLFTPRAAFYAASAFTFAPLFGIYDGSLAQTNCLMEFFVLGAVLCLVDILFPRNASSSPCWPQWIGAGFCFGLAMASKYTAVLLVPGFVFFLLSSGSERRVWFLRPQPYVAGLAACIPLLPVLIWNAQHDWVSFLYQGGRASWGEGLHPARALRWLAAQVFILQPWIFVVAITSLVRGLAAGPRRQSAWFLCCTSLIPLVLFPGVMLWSSHPIRGYHWASIGYLLLFPLVGDMVNRLVDRGSALARRWFGLTATYFALVVAVLATHGLTGWMAVLAPARVFAVQDPVLLELYDWTDLSRTLRERGFDPATTFVTGTRWEECAKAAYALKNTYRLLCLSDDNIHFSYLADPAEFAGQQAIVVDRYADIDTVKRDLDGHFSSIKEQPPITLHFRDRRMTELKIALARDFDGRWVKPLPGAKARQ